MIEPKYQLIVKVPAGVIVRDRPAPDSRGANKMRAEPVGKVLVAYIIINIGGVDYAGLIPQNPLRPEWVRVAEADHSIEYVEVIPLDGASTSLSANISAIANALNRVADAIEELKK
jgi:hypothetical protein